MSNESFEPDPHAEPPAGDPPHPHDEAFADWEPAPGVKVHNSEHEPNGAFRRFVRTPAGLDLVFPHTLPREDIGYMAVLFDEVAKANFESGRKAAQGDIRRALGFEK